MHPSHLSLGISSILLAFAGCSSSPKTAPYTDTACLSELATDASSSGANRPRREGSPSQAEIESRIESRRTGFKACYDQTLAPHQQTDGSLKIRLLIQESGQVSRACVEDSDFNHPRFHSCVLQFVQELQFTGLTNRGPLVISHPLKFKHRQDN